MEVGSPFGSRTRTRVLLALEVRGQSYARELARVLGAPLSVVQKALGSLERDALITGRMIGRTRLFQLDPGYPTLRQLRAFLGGLLEADDRLGVRAAKERRRPRRRRTAPEGQRAAGAPSVRRRGEERAEDRGPAVRPDEWKVW